MPRGTALLLSLAFAGIALLPLVAGTPEMEESWYVEERPSGVDVDGGGYVYTTGIGSGPEGADAYVQKNGPYGYIVWRVWLHGSGVDVGMDVDVAPDGTVFVTGRTSSHDFPVTPGAFDTLYGGDTDGFGVKLDADGDILWSTYLGGSDTEWAEGVRWTAGGGAVFAGSTWSCDYPTTPGAFDGTRGGSCDEFDADGYLTKLDADGLVVWSTYVGGTENDRAYGVDVHRDTGDVFIVGTTWADDFPTTEDALFPHPIGGIYDGFVARISSDGASLVYGTYLGGTEHERVYAVAVDAAGHAHVTGETVSSDFPVTAGAFQTDSGGGTMCSSYTSGPDPTWVERVCPDVFVTKLAPDGGSLAYSTFVATQHVEQGRAIDLDDAGYAYVTGFTNATAFPRIDDHGDARGATEAFSLAVTPNGRALAYSTVYGGSRNDYGMENGVLGSGESWHGGYTHSDDFPAEDSFDPDLGFLVNLGSPSDGVVFAHRGGNEWWVEVYTGGLRGGDVVQVEARDDGDDWTALEKKQHGYWAGSFHIEPGHTVEFRATLSDGSVVESCPFTHPEGEERCDLASFDATYDDVSGNEWWVQVDVEANQPIDSVHARIVGEEWHALVKRDWGAWAASFHVPEGSVVQFRATSDTGATDLSGCHRWTAATPTDCPAEEDPGDSGDAAFAFDHAGGNEWWIEAVVEPMPDEVQARDTGGAWRTLTFRDWGEWAGSFHIEPGHEVQFRARTGDGAWVESCWHTHPEGAVTTCDGADDGGDGAFGASFHDVRGNEWWVETEVDAQGGELAGVDARVDGGAWTALKTTDWGSWARSMHAPAGSTVEFRARSVEGETAVSGPYDWPPG